MRLLIGRFEVRVARPEERARGERVAGLVRRRLGATLARESPAEHGGAAGATTSPGGGRNGGGGGPRGA